MSSISTRTNTMTGEVFGYRSNFTAIANHVVAQRMARVEAELVHFIEPFVEAGFDLHQIAEELSHRSDMLVPLGRIDSIIKEILAA